jgi:protein-tyrosine kinase
MSIVERMAELLGSAPATGEPRWRLDFPGGADLAVESKAKREFTHPAEATGRTLTIDLDRLRRHGMVTPDGMRTPIAECFRRIKRRILTNMVQAKAGAPVNCIMVTSALAGEGKTFCATNLAISIASEMDRTVLLVDADVANPSVPRTLGFEAEGGLMDLLLDREINPGQVLYKTNIDKLRVLPAGKPHEHATELLASAAMRSLLREMATRYDDRIIIFDSPPLLSASEAGVLANQMGQIVLVVEAGRTTETALKEALSSINTSNVAGLLLNKGDNAGLEYWYGGYGYGSYGQRKPREDTK